MKKILFMPFLATLFSFNANAEQNQSLNLSLQESIEMAINRNLDLKVEYFNPQIQELETQKLKDSFNLVAGFAPTLRSNIQPTSNSFISGGTTLEQFFQSYNLYLTKRFSTGGELSIKFDNSINSTNSTRVDFNPTFGPSLSLNFNHPLLKNSFNGTKRILISENQNEISFISLKSKIIDTINQTKQAYWETVAAKLRVEVLENSLKLSEQLLKDNEERLKAGFASKIDILNAQAAIAAKQESLYQTKNNLGNSQDNLKKLINPDEKYFQNWQFNINTTDLPKYIKRTFVLDDVYKKALERPDYKISLINNKNLEIQTEINEKNRLPALDLITSAGLQTIDKTYMSSLAQLFSLKGYFWTVGLNYEMPIHGNPNETEYKQSLLNQDKQKHLIENIKQKIYNEVRNSLRVIETNKQRINVNNNAKKLAEEQLKAENEKLKSGFSTSFQVLQYQRDLEQAGLNEISSIIDYLKSLSTLEQVTGTSIEDNNLKI
jgi:outer membrane protein